MTRFFVLAALLLGSGFLRAAPSGERAIRVATYNVRNYLSMDRQVDGQFRVDYPKPESEKLVVRETIREVAPDILALQEIGSELYLLELRDDLAREGLVYEHYAIMDGYDSVRHVAALWNDEAEIEVVKHDDLTFNYFGKRFFSSRGMLELKVERASGNGFASIFVLHLKSKYTSDKRDYQSAKQRILEAQASRDRILEVFPEPRNSRFLIVGDLNDTPDSRPIRRFLKRGDVELSRVVRCEDSSGMIWTHFYKKGATYSQVDYVLQSPGWGIQHQGSGRIAGRDDYYDGSDHRLVWMDLLID